MQTAAAAGLLIGGASSYAKAKGQNDAIRSSMGSNEIATKTKLNQLAVSAAFERQKSVDEAQAILSKLRSIEAESGGTGGSFDALQLAATVDAGKNQIALNENYKNAVASTQSEYMARARQLAGGYSNPILAALMGGMQGVSMGLGIGNLFTGAGEAAATAGGTAFDGASAGGSEDLLSRGMGIYA